MSDLQPAWKCNAQSYSQVYMFCNGDGWPAEEPSPHGQRGEGKGVFTCSEAYGYCRGTCVLAGSLIPLTSYDNQNPPVEQDGKARSTTLGSHPL